MGWKTHAHTIAQASIRQPVRTALNDAHNNDHDQLPTDVKQVVDNPAGSRERDSAGGCVSRAVSKGVRSAHVVIACHPTNVRHELASMSTTHNIPPGEQKTKKNDDHLRHPTTCGIISSDVYHSSTTNIPRNQKLTPFYCNTCYHALPADKVRHNN